MRRGSATRKKRKRKSGTGPPSGRDRTPRVIATTRWRAGTVTTVVGAVARAVGAAGGIVGGAARGS